MRYLGIDYGTKRVGIATAPHGSTMAFPSTTLRNSDALVADIVAICQKDDVDAIVIGKSLDFQNRPNPIMREIERFATDLEKASGLPIHFMNEVLSSREATHIQGDNDANDASAAAIILQSYLESLPS